MADYLKFHAFSQMSEYTDYESQFGLTKHTQNDDV
jgi:hypothetical protein